MSRQGEQASRLARLFEEAVQAHAAGATGRAEKLYGQVLAADPHHPLANYNLALLLISSGRLKPARVRLLSLLKASPDDAAAHHTLAMIFRSEGELGKSEVHFRRALALDPKRIDTVLELIETYGRLRRLDDARRIADRVETTHSGKADIATKLGLAFIAAGEQPAARVQFEAALKANPNHVLALYNLGKLCDEQGDAESALALYRRAQAADPAFEPAAFNIAELELRLGEIDAAIAGLDRLLARNPSDPATLSGRFMAAQYQPGIDAKKLFELHRTWDAGIGQRIGVTDGYRSRRPEPERRLRVGLVSPDLGDHPVGYFTIRALENLDSRTFELVAFADADRDDAISRRLRRCLAGWNDASQWPDDRLAAEIARQGIDILIDLSGHTRGNRLAVFSRRPAPIQLSWAGYVGTTGLSAMDALIADRFHVPIGEDEAYAEKVVRLPDSYICFDPPPDAPDPAAIGRRDGPLTLAAFHLPAKINDGVVDLWARILYGEPGSCLSFVYAGYEVPGVQSRLRGLFAAAGIAGERLLFTGRQARAEVLKRYGSVDIALDPLPYSGGLTTLEALWMGVPVVTLPGKSFAGRHAASHLSNAGLSEFVARDAEDYVAIVHRLAADRERLAALRGELRQRVAASALCDGKRFAQSLQSAIRDLWRNWCRSQEAGSSWNR